MKHVNDETKKKKISAMDIYIALVLIIFYVIDIAYAVIQYNMGLQLSDFWIAINAIVPIVEILACMIIKISKESNGKIDPQTKELLTLLTTIVASMTGNQLPYMTSGAVGVRPEVEENYIDEEEELDNGNISQ